MFVGMMDCTLAYLFIRHLFCMPLFCTSPFSWALGIPRKKKKKERDTFDPQGPSETGSGEGQMGSPVMP